MSDRVLVLFGASGHLAARKLYPGFFHLFREEMMPEPGWRLPDT